MEKCRNLVSALVSAVYIHLQARLIFEYHLAADIGVIGD